MPVMSWLNSWFSASGRRVAAARGARARAKPRVHGRRRRARDEAAAGLAELLRVRVLLDVQDADAVLVVEGDGYLGALQP